MNHFGNAKEELTSLQQHFGAGNQIEFLYFWRHLPESDSDADRSCLSQWHDSGFEIGKIRYATAEHWMMASKARLFGDRDVLEEILQTKDPCKAQSLGRTVKRFSPDVWKQESVRIVFQGNLCKFQQNVSLRNYLLTTGDKVLVEASPHDPIWGVGLGENDSSIGNPFLWRGVNQLGFVLMAVRHAIRSEA